MSYKVGEEIHIDDDDASGGEKTGVMRWVLAISLLGAVVLMSIIWMTGALSQDETESQTTVSAKQDQVDAGDNTDGIAVGEEQSDIGNETRIEDGVSVIENE